MTQLSLKTIKHCAKKAFFTQNIFSGNTHFASFTRAMTGPRQGSRVQQTSFCTPVCVFYHNIPTCTPKSGSHRVTKVAKNTDMEENGYEMQLHESNSAYTKPIEWDPETGFWLKIEKNQKIRDFQPPKKGAHFCEHPPQPPTPSKAGFQGRGLGGSRQ